MKERLSTSVMKGVTWFGASQALSQGLNFVSIIVLARLLVPADFGVVALSAIVTDLVLVVGDLGFSEAVIQRKQVTEGHLSAAFFTGLALGILFCVLTVAISPLVADFFHNDLVRPVLAISSLSFVIAPLRTVHGALLKKRLEFSKFAYTEMGQSIIYMVTTISLAFTGFGVWSLVIGNLAGQLALVVLRWIVCRWHPSVRFAIQDARDLWGFGINVTGSSVVKSLIGRLDQLLIGRFITATAVGYYRWSRTLTGYPVNALSMAVGRVALATFSVVQDEEERIRRAFAKTVAYLSIITFPLFTGIAVVAPAFVRVVLGEKWAPAILPMQILCVAGAIECISITAAPVLRAKGRPEIELRILLIRVALLVPALLIGVKFGTVGVAIAASFVSFTTWIIIQVFANRVIGLGARDYLSSLVPAFSGSVVLAAVLLAFGYAASLINLPDIGLLVASVILGIVSYFTALKFTGTKVMNEMVELVVDVAKPYAKSMKAAVWSVFE